MRRDIFKFATVGAINTIIDFSLLSLFVLLGMNIFLALSISYTIGAVNGYLLNNHWTYGHLNQRSNVGALLRYVSISFVGLGFTEIIVFILFNVFHVGVGIDKLVAVAVVFGWNYSANRHFTFKASTPKHAGASVGKSRTNR